jgi:phosphoglycerol transferase MdoB-like AlkP superfamily enzyme
MSFGTSSQLGAVVDYIKDFLHSIKLIYYTNFIPFVLVLLYLIFLERKLYNPNRTQITKEHKKHKFYMKSLNFAGTALVLVSAYYITITAKFMQNDLQLTSNKDLIVNPSVPSTAIHEFGTTMFALGDIRVTLFPMDEQLSYTYNKKKSDSVVVSDYTRVIDDASWENVIANEKNNTYNTLNNYFISQNITDKNEYTGMFKDKNVIVIMMESISDIFINPELFPNFYKLYSEGWHWENNYSPRNSCATGNNEMSGMLSLYTINNNCTANTYKNNTYYESIFNLYNNAGYRTTSMHDYTEAYYYRSTIHRNMGSGRYYGVKDLGISYSNEYVNWASDEDFMVKVLDILKETDDGRPFMTWLTTVSAHQPYTASSILGDKYLSSLSEYNYPKELKRYLSKAKVTDDGLGVLLKGLEEQGKLDDTVIVLYGDHYPYGMNKSTIKKILTYDLNDYEVERVPFVIYNSKLEPKTFTEYTSYINIVPTLANLFDLDYDPRLYMGTDLLSDDYESLVVFADGSWKNERAYYNASTGSIKNYTDNPYTNEEIKDINERVSYKMKMSSLAIKNNYFKYLNDALEKYKVESNVVAQASTDDNQTLDNNVTN